MRPYAHTAPCHPCTFFAYHEAAVHCLAQVYSASSCGDNWDSPVAEPPDAIFTYFANV